jgi:type I site-specific restriction-modification system R (restriction) subunit
LTLSYKGEPLQSGVPDFSKDIFRNSEDKKSLDRGSNKFIKTDQKAIASSFREKLMAEPLIQQANTPAALKNSDGLRKSCQTNHSMKKKQETYYFIHNPNVKSTQKSTQETHNTENNATDQSGSKITAMTPKNPKKNLSVNLNSKVLSSYYTGNNTITLRKPRYC